jgi:hypothetical protein
LLPEQRYAEATEWASKVQRPYAEELLLSLIATEQSYRQMTEVAQSDEKRNAAVNRLVFCGAVVKLQAARLKASDYILSEPDVSYNNILRTIDTQLKQRYGSAKIICAYAA